MEARRTYTLACSIFWLDYSLLIEDMSWGSCYGTFDCERTDVCIRMVKELGGRVWVIEVYLSLMAYLYRRFVLIGWYRPGLPWVVLAVFSKPGWSMYLKQIWGGNTLWNSLYLALITCRKWRVVWCIPPFVSLPPNSSLLKMVDCWSTVFLSPCY